MGLCGVNLLGQRRVLPCRIVVVSFRPNGRSITLIRVHGFGAMKEIKLISIMFAN